MKTKRISTKPPAPVRPRPFSRLTPAQKRVAIAKDAIKQILAKKYQLKNGEYVIGTRRKMDQKFLLKKKRPVCKCCHLGALLLSSIRLANESIIPASGAGHSQTYNQLSKFFGHNELSNMEYAFEKWFNPSSSFAHWNSFKSNDARTIAICKNIIRNRGTFIPQEV